MDAALLRDWDNYYVIVGSAAAGLTGLTFVVIALAAERKGVTTSGLRAFVTPTIVHFGSVLGISAYLSMPGLSALAVRLGLAAAGLAGLLYAGVSAASMRRMGSRYVPVGEDWLWHVILPGAAYAVLIGVACFSGTLVPSAPYVVAGTTLMLLFTGIHNAWDVASTISLRRH